MTWSSAEDIQMVWCTAPDLETAARVGRAIVNMKLAACVNIVPGLRSLYTWQGKVCDEPEVLMIMKTRRELAEPLARLIKEHHPYETPEIIATRVVGGLDMYLDWVRDSTKP